MALKKRTKIILFTIIALIAVILLQVCYMFFPRSIYNLLPNEEIVSITMYEYLGEGNEPPIEKEKIDEFINILKGIKYKENYKSTHSNCRCIDEPDISFAIQYPNYTIIFNTHFVKKIKNGKTIKYDKVLEIINKDKYEQLKELCRQ